MNASQFWHSTDGQILTVKNTPDGANLTLTLAFWPRHPAEMEFLKGHLAQIHFTERSTLARIGIDVTSRGQPVVDNNRLLMDAEAFMFDSSFTNAATTRNCCGPERRSDASTTPRRRPNSPPAKSGAP